MPGDFHTSRLCESGWMQSEISTAVVNLESRFGHTVSNWIRHHFSQPADGEDVRMRD